MRPEIKLSTKFITAQNTHQAGGLAAGFEPARAFAQRLAYASSSVRLGA